MKKYSIVLFLFPFFLSMIQVLTKSDLVQMNLKGKLKSVSEKQFAAVKDNSGQIQKGQGYAWNQMISFNEDGNKTEHIQSTSSGGSITKAVYKYEGKQRTEINTFWQDGSLTTTITFKYNSKGLEVERYVSDVSSSEKYKRDLKTTYKYDSLGNQIEQDVYYVFDKVHGKTTYKYDGKGNLTEENQLMANGSSAYKYGYKYDAKGNMIEKTNTVQSVLKNTFTYKYEFDKLGNWIKKTEFDGGKPLTITERTYTYY